MIIHDAYHHLTIKSNIHTKIKLNISYLTLKSIFKYDSNKFKNSDLNHIQTNLKIQIDHIQTTLKIQI